MMLIKIYSLTLLENKVQIIPSGGTLRISVYILKAVFLLAFEAIVFFGIRKSLQLFKELLENLLFPRA